MTDRARAAGAMWALIGVLLLFANAVWQLGARGVTVMRDGLDATHWLALAALVTIFVYGEGVRALQRRWVPHLLRRVGRLRGEQRVAYHLLGPLYAMSLVGAPVRTMAYAWSGVVAIVLAVVIVSRFTEPWRGIADFAVASALGWGLITLAHGAWRTRFRGSPDDPP